MIPHYIVDVKFFHTETTKKTASKSTIQSSPYNTKPFYYFNDQTIIAICNIYQHNSIFLSQNVLAIFIYYAFALFL